MVRVFFFRRIREAAMVTYLGVALGEKVAPDGGLFEAICDDENERKATLFVEWRWRDSTGGGGIGPQMGLWLMSVLLS